MVRIPSGELNQLSNIGLGLGVQVKPYKPLV